MAISMPGKGERGLLPRSNDSEPVHDLLRVGHAALKPGSKCSFTARKLRFFA
ncbi:hypothetical protein ACK25U_21225 [Ectopseudomonas mendocina]